MLDQSAARVAVGSRGLERHPEPLPGLLPERNLGVRLEGLSGDAKLVEGHNPSGSDALRGRPEEGDGIGLVNQDVSADHRIEGLGIGEG